MDRREGRAAGANASKGYDMPASPYITGIAEQVYCVAFAGS